MLGDAKVGAIVPVSDIDRAISFYEGTLGLKLVRRSEREEALFEAEDSVLVAYKSVGAGQSRHTIAGWKVDDIDAVAEGLRGRGVVFEEYDMPELKTENGIATVGVLRAAWFKDPDGNILVVSTDWVP